ncbi:uracil-DNA glycosylase [Curvivirga aplysinae]|uniref:uracil-DNA glycosylase n=1 Tax=Curvivirga aplysinae TaxID=2529852 RepID=UPI0012BBF2F5|nr:uracil-DNA glycosylase [Curvivirga aplysinae]MTI08410.1 uracil-DNA glycosylase [Curvivirga aplysinae]
MDQHDIEMTISDAISALQWQIEMGADEALIDSPVDRYASVIAQQEAKAAAARAVIDQARTKSNVAKPAAPAPMRPSPSAPLGAAEAIEAARKLVETCDSLKALKTAAESFEGLGTLKTSASNTVFGDGNPNADIMIIGEIPEKQDDVSGRAFSDRGGLLLDKMFNAIHLTRENFFASNLVFWRPAGGSSPTDGQLAVCKTFIEKQIELVQPKMIVCLGAKPVNILLNQTGGISRMRGKWIEHKFEYLDQPVEVMPIFAPLSLIKTPAQKRLAWRDLLEIQQKSNAF